MTLKGESGGFSLRKILIGGMEVGMLWGKGDGTYVSGSSAS
jgi:hypothetical protein